jgi:hypothetical protein
VKKETASAKSIQEFRDAVAASLGADIAVLLHLIDVLATGPRPGSPVELTQEPALSYDWSSLYQALRRAERRLAETIDQDDWLRYVKPKQEPFASCPSALARAIEKGAVDDICGGFAHLTDSI